MAALDCATDAVMILDRTGVVQYLNRVCLTLLARDRSDHCILGRHVLGLVCLDGTATKNILRALRHANVWSGTLQVELGARCRAVDVSVCRVAGRNARTQSFSVIARPARAITSTPSANASDTAAQLGSSADLGQYMDVLSTVARVASEMAHDFNNQLAVVLNYSFILLRELPTRSPMRAHVSELQGAAWRAAEVAREILRFGARRSVDATDIDVHELLRATQAILGSMLGGGQAKVELRLAAQSCLVLARRAQLEWLLFELSARLQSRLGRLATLRISTTTTLSGSKPEYDRPRVMIALDAHVAPGAREHLLAEADTYPCVAASAEPAGAPPGLRAAERTLEHARGELTLHMLPDGGLRYLICLPSTPTRV